MNKLKQSKMLVLWPLSKLYPLVIMRKAIEEATASIKDNPNNADAYSVRGFATALSGDTTKGLVDTKRLTI